MKKSKVKIKYNQPDTFSITIRYSIKSFPKSMTFEKYDKSIVEDIFSIPYNSLYASWEEKGRRTLKISSISKNNLPKFIERLTDLNDGILREIKVDQQHCSYVDMN